MKVGLVYTSTTPELIADVERNVKEALSDYEASGNLELMSYSDPSILADVRERSYVYAQPAARLVSMFMQAVQDGADIIFNLCSSVGEVADASQDLAKYLGVPIVRVDEEMAYEAARLSDCIAVMATLPTTLEPTMNTIKRTARELGRHPEIVPCLVDGAFGLDQDQFRALMLDYAKKVAPEVDLIVFAQGSMAYCEEYIEREISVKTLSSPRFGANALAETVKKLAL